MDAVAERRNSDQTRERILEVAWDLFRELGARTTIADVARVLGMSSANVYRFYASKQALCEAVAASQLGKMAEAAREVAGQPCSAARRIREITLLLHTAMRDQMTHESRVHEIVAIAINEGWTPINDFERQVGTMIAELVGEGQSNGEFGPGDPVELAQATMAACVCIHHPTLIAKTRDPQLVVAPEVLIDFALRALANKAPFPTP